MKGWFGAESSSSVSLLGDGLEFGSGAVSAEVTGQVGEVVVAYSGTLELTHDRAEPDPVYIGTQFLKRGTSIFNELRGDWCIALIDLKHRRVTLAVDRMGIRRLTFGHADGVVAFSDRATELAALFQVEVRPQALYDLLFFHMVPSHNTTFESIGKVPPASYVTIEDGIARLERYWSPQFSNGDKCEFEPMRDELHRVIASAVGQHRASRSRVGAFLSGGIDSSTIAGFLQRVSPPASTYSIGFDLPEYDELPFASKTNEHFGCSGHQYRVTPDDVVGSFPSIVRAFDEPFGNSSVVPTYFCARLARENGTEHLLAGDGGDELFGGNERYARQKLFDLYQRLPAVVRSRIVEPMSRLISSRSPTIIRKARSYVEQASIPLPERLESWNFAYREGAAGLLDRDFLQRIDLNAPFRHMRDVYTATEAVSGVDKLLAYDWRLTLADNDLRKVTTMCALAGVSVSFPLLAPEVVDFSLRVPPAWKVRRLELRHFYRRAMRGFLPDAALDKQKHGFGLPFGPWLKTHSGLQRLVNDRLDALKSRRIFDEAFLENLLASHQAGQANYYGYFIWDLVILEEWLSQLNASTNHSVALRRTSAQSAE